MIKGCNANSSDLEALGDESVGGKILVPLVKFAHEFDHHSETLLNSIMCTELCPCFNAITYETTR